MKDKPVSYYAFEVLYWTGIREGELLALERGDFNISDRKLTINKSYQHLQGEDYITSPKTEKSNRVIELPEFLCREMEDYFGIVGVAKALAQVGDRLPNETIAIMVHWLLFIIVIVGAIAVVGILIVIIEKKVTKLYRENCWDVISVGVTVTSLALAVYFGDWIKELVRLNLVALLLLVQTVYFGIRVYVRGCKRARGYY